MLYMSNISFNKNGPMVVTGPIVVMTKKGPIKVGAGEKVYLCRCGHSKDKPFCDGSHAKNGFTADGSSDE